MRVTGAERANILTATQQRFLEGFFQVGAASVSFYLSGGTALSAFYLRHRYSDDLDFFTRDRADLDAEAHRERLERALAHSGLAVERSLRRGDHVQYVFGGDVERERPLTKVDMVFDSPPYFAAPRDLGGVRVDDLLAIAVNKVTALGRREPRDYADLYEIVRTGRHRLEDLMALAAEKDLGMTPLMLAVDFEDVVSLRRVAEFLQRYLLIPLEWDEVVRFYQQWAWRLRESLPPRAGGSAK